MSSLQSHVHGRTCIAAWLLAGIALTAAAAASAASAEPDLTQQVNTFIGTQDDGNTFPGASAPFGMIQVSPIGTHYSGWRYDDQKIRGFGHFFLSGAGCWEQGGQVSVLPVTGAIGPGAAFDTGQAESFDQKNYASGYSHDGEVGQAGYYKVRLIDYGGIEAETTALTRAAAERYTFSSGDRQTHVLVNLGQANERHRVTRSALRIVGDRSVEGEVETLSFCGGTRYTTWFRLQFDRPFKDYGTWDKGGGKPGSRESLADEAPNGAWLSFDTRRSKAVTIVSAISHVDAEGARGNLRSEGMNGKRLLGFDEMKQQAQTAWRNELGTVRVDGGSVDDRVVFYTALYHTLLQPLTGNDADGRYRGWDNRVHAADGWTYYEFFSLWDTYRTQSQWLAMLRPQRARDIAKSVLKIHEQGGWLPRWGFANYETNIMTGDPVTPFLVDLWRFGALEGREKQAYAALKQNADGLPPASSRMGGRSGNENYLKQGFVQYDKAFKPKGMDVDPHHGGSATLEYALADCSLALMAQGLGETGDAARYRERGRNWRKVWDADVRDKEHGFTGFPRPRTLDGQWYAPDEGAYSPASDDGFHEGTAWQYQWLAQQDVPELMQAMGGKRTAVERLDTFFAYGDLLAHPWTAARKNWVVGPYSYYNQYRYNPNNEPDLHSPWMYTLIGEPWKTSTVLRAAQALFTNAPNGVTGNDDLGTMSAWYLFSAIGLYPAMPGTGRLLLHAPRFVRVELDLGDGKTLRIEAAGADGRKLQYVAGARIDGAISERAWVDWEQMRRGGTIAFDLTARSGERWGTRDADLPASACALTGQP